MYTDMKGKRLLFAAKAGQNDEVRRLLSTGIDPNTRHTLGWTALHGMMYDRMVHILDINKEKMAV